MEKFELEHKLKEEIRARVLGADFMKLVQSVRRNGKQFKISFRPVEIGGERMAPMPVLGYKLEYIRKVYEYLMAAN
jgi:hypothetical protein